MWFSVKMTSSSDTEFTKRRIYVDGLPMKSSSAEVRALFAGKFLKIWVTKMQNCFLANLENFEKCPQNLWNWFHVKFYNFLRFCTTQCGSLENLFSLIFDKNFVKTQFWTKSQFHEILFHCKTQCGNERIFLSFTISYFTWNWNQFE